VTITGTNFAGTPTVTLGGSSCSVLTVSSTEITCTTTAHAAGTVNVSVTTPGGTGTLTDGYTYYAAPTVTDVNPGSGPGAGGTSVTITGTGFYGVPGVSLTVTFGGNACTTNIVVVNDTTITCDTPSHADGFVDVSVTTDSGTGTLTNGFEYYGSPTVLLVDPDQGPTTGGTAVTITGTNFFGTPTVDFGGSACTGVVVNSSTELTCTTTGHISGLVDVSVTTGNGTGTLTDGFRYTCAAGDDEQCVEAEITGSISFDVPDDFSFPAMSSTYMPQDSFSFEATGYNFNTNDLLTVYDSRNSGGFMVQAHQTTPFETSGGVFHIPLNNFFIATTSAITGGYAFDPPSDDGIEYDSTPVTPCDSSSVDVTTFPRSESAYQSLLWNGSTFAGQNLGTDDPDTYITYDLMNCSLLTGGRTGTFKQNVNYYLNVPGGQSAGTYNVTITFDLIT